MRILTVSFVLFFCVLGNAQNFLRNGDFELGNTGFQSEYTENCNNISTGEFCVTVPTDWTAVNPLWNPVQTNNDSVGGNILHVNGDGEVGKKIWCQTVMGLQGNEPYELSFYITPIHLLNTAKIGFTANGNLIGDTITPGNASGSWIRYELTFNPGSSSSAELCLVNLNNDDEGNDFALDNFRLKPLGIKFPNIFVPNSNVEDNLTFKPLEFSGIEDYEFKVYNRNGLLVHHSDQNVQAEPEWDGFFKGSNRTCPAGTYYWMLSTQSANIESGNTSKQINGFVQLVD